MTVREFARREQVLARLESFSPRGREAVAAGGIFGTTARAGVSQLVGLACPYNELSFPKPGPDGKPRSYRFRPRAFMRSLSAPGLRRRPVRLLIDHDPRRQMGTTDDHWLTLWEADAGLMLAIDATHPGGAAVADRIATFPNLSRNLSVAFDVNLHTVIEAAGGERVWDVTDATLKELSILPAGAFPRTFLVSVPG